MADDRLGPILAEAFDKLVSTAQRSGYFVSSISYEPKSAPTGGLTFACWLGSIQPVPPRSGLPATSARAEILCRIYSNMLAEPQDKIDIDLSRAASHLLAELTGDLGIDGAYIDLLGAYGDPLGAETGYVSLDQTMFRIADIPVPFIADDVYNQAE